MNPQLQTPVPHEQHGTRSPPPLNALKLRIIELLKAGKTYEEITDETDATRYLVIKVSQQMVGKDFATRGLFPSPAANRTTCTRKPNCECVWHRAEAEREKRLALKRSALKTTPGPSEARNACIDATEPLEAMPDFARDLP